MWRGFGDPSGRRAGASSRGEASRMMRAADSAARSAARCTRALPVTAPPIEARTRAHPMSAAAAASTTGSACPLWPPLKRPSRGAGANARASRRARSEATPPGLIPARARRAASSGGGRASTRAAMPRARSSDTHSAASDRSPGRSASSRPASGRRPGLSMTLAQSSGTTCTTSNSTPAPSASSAIGRGVIALRRGAEVADVAARGRVCAAAAKRSLELARRGRGQQRRRAPPRLVGDLGEQHARLGAGSDLDGERGREREAAAAVAAAHDHRPAPLAQAPSSAGSLTQAEDETASESPRAESGAGGSNWTTTAPVALVDLDAVASPTRQRRPGGGLRLVADDARERTRLSGAVGERERVAGGEELEADQRGDEQRGKPGEQLDGGLAARGRDEDHPSAAVRLEPRRGCDAALAHAREQARHVHAHRHPLLIGADARRSGSARRAARSASPPTCSARAPERAASQPTTAPNPWEARGPRSRRRPAAPEGSPRARPRPGLDAPARRRFRLRSCPDARRG